MSRLKEYAPVDVMWTRDDVSKHRTNSSFGSVCMNKSRPPFPLILASTSFSCSSNSHSYKSIFCPRPCLDILSFTDSISKATRSLLHLLTTAFKMHKHVLFVVAIALSAAASPVSLASPGSLVAEPIVNRHAEVRVNCVKSDQTLRRLCSPPNMASLL